ncbi:D-inositol-3-phosphate glycosyltransferase [Methylobacterium oxalidis]|nr:D-inositol-3-phosphate glycosyltransferase [Methylobacterium oxalidis]
MRMLFDARCLQDPNFRYRGVGQHSFSLIYSARSSLSAKNVEIGAFVDPSLPCLDCNQKDCFDHVLSGVLDDSHLIDWFVQLSPMTHSGTPLRRVLRDTSVFKIAVAYDLIQFIQPEYYLASPVAQASFLTSCAQLRKYDCYAAISQFTAEQIKMHLRITADRVFVTGCAVRPSLIRPAADQSGRQHRSGILVAGGRDPRKNPECALKAHAGSPVLQQAGVPVTVTGNYDHSTRAHLLDLIQKEGGDPALVSFTDHLTDAEFADLYYRHLLTVVPSTAEGFSLPVIEASANGAVVLVSDTTAHPELVPNNDYRFDPHDHERLAAQLEHLIGNETSWIAARAEQADMWRPYTVAAVCYRFWSGVLDQATRLRWRPIDEAAR